MNYKTAYALSIMFLTICILPVSAETKNGTDVKSHKIEVILTPGTHQMKVKDTIKIEAANKIVLYLNKEFKIDVVALNGKEADYEFKKDYDSSSAKIFDDNFAADFKRAAMLTIELEKPGKQAVVIAYSGYAKEAPKASKFSREFVANITPAYIGEEGTFLSPEYFWYPRSGVKNDMASFHVITRSPSGYETVTQGERLERKTDKRGLLVEWKNDNPADGIYLQAGEYIISEDSIDDIKVYTYFFKGGERLSKLYLEKSKKYIRMYENLLGEYPYKKFAVVENFFETGYGMPSWTLLGKTVIRLPWIPDTSLPHEICHNWWGNSVFVDYETGNWCEGLTVYCADYLLKKIIKGKEEAREYRQIINRDYAAYVNEGNDFPLTQFRSRHNPAERTIGYGKAMMVFHQIQRDIGEKKFFEGLQLLAERYRFETAGWRDIFRIFEEVSDEKISRYYKEWVARKGSPQLKMSSVTTAMEREWYKISFELEQTGNIYNLSLPVSVVTRKGTVKETFKLNQRKSEFSIYTSQRPLSLSIDPDHDLFRLLYIEEIPPSVSIVFGDEKQLIIMPTSVSQEKRKQYDTTAGMINKLKTAIVIDDIDVKPENLNGRSIIVLGAVDENKYLNKLAEQTSKKPRWKKITVKDNSLTDVIVYRHPEDVKRGLMIISGGDKADIIIVTRKLPHYGKYSYLRFDGRKNIDKGTWIIEDTPLIYNFENSSDTEKEK